MISPSVQAALAAAGRAPLTGNIADMVTGALSSPVAGRTDHLPISVPANAYVIPADVVSALGEGNTNSGVLVLDRVFGQMAQQAGSTGGAAKVDIMAAGGEFIVSPQAVAAIGGGDMRAGHSVLDAFVRKVRHQNIRTLRTMPGPKKR